MRRFLCPCTCAGAALLVTTCAWAAGPYDFTLLASTGPQFGNVYEPSINNAGSVAFAGGPPGTTVPFAVNFVRDGGVIHTYHPAPGNFFPTSSGIQVNDLGLFTYYASAPGLGQSGVAVTDGTNARFVSVGAGGTGHYDPYEINNAAQVMVNFGILEHRFVHRHEPDGSTTVILDSAGPYLTFSARGLSESGRVYARAGTDDAGGRINRLVTGAGGPVDVIYDDPGPGRAYGPFGANDDGMLAFVELGRVNNADVEWLYRGNGGPRALLADTLGPYAHFSNPQLNLDQTVVFQASLDGNAGVGIFLGPDPLADRLIRTGDSLFGSTVTAVQLSPQAINGAGQIVFLSSLADGRKVIVRADPIPEPAGIAGVVVLAMCAARRRRP